MKSRHIYNTKMKKVVTCDREREKRRYNVRNIVCSMVTPEGVASSWIRQYYQANSKNYARFKNYAKFLKRSFKIFFVQKTILDSLDLVARHKQYFKVLKFMSNCDDAHGLYYYVCVNRFQ